MYIYIYIERERNRASSCRKLTANIILGRLCGRSSIGRGFRLSTDNRTFLPDLRFGDEDHKRSGHLIRKHKCNTFVDYRKWQGFVTGWVRKKLKRLFTHEKKNWSGVCHWRLGCGEASENAVLFVVLVFAVVSKLLIVVL